MVSRACGFGSASSRASRETMNSTTGVKMSPQVSAIHSTIDPTSSRFTVRAFAAGLLSGFGHNPVIAFRDFSGEVSFAPDDITKSSVGITIKAGSFEVQNDVSEKDRREIIRTMNDQVLEVGRFPDIAFLTGTRSFPSPLALGAAKRLAAIARISRAHDLHG